MPIKYNLTWADTLSNKIHRVSQKDPKNLDEEDIKLKRIGIIVAAFASSHSWQTYKAARENLKLINSQEVKAEFQKAAAEGWKDITYSDINEIAKENSIEQAFDSWLFFNIGKEEHADYKLAWKTLKEYFRESCDDVKSEEDAES
ncbi:MAG: hypothetical protein QXR58_03190 [Candidatus Micrarchaeaceae archaeon]